ncbi:MAG: HD domain-containing phosphohydrolase [Opitutaceae bacterium]|nr:HD domain-containing phosphohydrolase [Opitutaceae bacterium]
MNKKILCVDDDANILAGFQRNLRKQFDLATALGGEQGLAAIEADGPFAVVVADMQMPGMNGIQFLTRVEQASPDTVRVMLTGNADQKTAMDAVNEGHVFRFLTKPCSPESLAATLEAALGHHRLITAEREILERTLNGTTKVLGDILSILDPVAFGLGQKLRDCMRACATHLKMAQTWDLELAAMLCQIGYVAIPARVLTNHRGNVPLKPEEKDMLARVPRTGSDLLANIPRLENVSRIVLYQQKNFDGTGFPNDSVKGEEIPLGSRLLRVLADLLELESHGQARAKALAELRGRAGHYDPRMLELVGECFQVGEEAVDRQNPTVMEVTLQGLRVNHMLVEKIETNDGVMIMGAGTLITPMLLEKLRNFSTVVGVREPLFVV